MARVVVIVIVILTHTLGGWFHESEIFSMPLKKCFLMPMLCRAMCCMCQRFENVLVRIHFNKQNRLQRVLLHANASCFQKNLLLRFFLRMVITHAFHTHT